MWSTFSYLKSTFVWIRQVKFCILISKFEIWFTHQSEALLKQVFFCWKWGYFKNNLIINELLLKMSLALSIHTDFTTIEHFSRTTGCVSHKVFSNGNLLYFQDRPMISDNYLLNLFSFYDYSNSLILRVWLIKIRSWIKLYHRRTNYKIFHDLMLSPVIFKYSDLNNIYCNITNK